MKPGDVVVTHCPATHYSKEAKAYAIVQRPEKACGIGWMSNSNIKTAESFRYIFKRSSEDKPHGWS